MPAWSPTLAGCRHREPYPSFCSSVCEGTAGCKTQTPVGETCLVATQTASPRPASHVTRGRAPRLPREEEEEEEGSPGCSGP